MKRYIPSVYSTVIVLVSLGVVYFVFAHELSGWVSCFIAAIAAVIIAALLALASYLWFPRIVVTVDNFDTTQDTAKNLTMLADGREIYKEADIKLPLQFSFQVWKRAKYHLCLKTEDSSESKKTTVLVKDANTYEHNVCSVRFPGDEKTEAGS